MRSFIFCTLQKYYKALQMRRDETGEIFKARGEMRSAHTISAGELEGKTTKET
jgi:hypothetical protein